MAVQPTYHADRADRGALIRPCPSGQSEGFKRGWQDSCGGLSRVGMPPRGRDYSRGWWACAAARWGHLTDIAPPGCSQCGAASPDHPDTDKLCRYPACGDGCLREIGRAGDLASRVEA